MEKTIKGILLEEINRSRQIMGLSLITEGTIYDEIADFFFRVGKSSVDDLSAEERAIFNKLVSNSTSLQNAGIRSIDDLSDATLRRTFLKTLSKSRDEIIGAFTKSIDNYTSDALSKIRNNMSLDLDNMVKTTQVSNQGSILDILKKVETDGASSVRPQTLTLLKSELENIKLKPSISSSVDNIKYVDEMISQIDDNINLRQIDFGKQIDDVSIKVDDLKPTVKPVDDDVTNMDDISIESIMQKFANDYPDDFPIYKAKIENMGLKTKVKNQMLVSFKDYHDWTAKQLASEAEKVLIAMNKTDAAKWSWLKKSITDVTTGKISIPKTALWVGGVGISLTALYLVARFTWFAGELGDEGIDELREMSGLDNPSFTTDDCQKWFDDNEYTGVTATEVELDADGTSCKCAWETTGGQKGKASFVLRDGVWVSNE